MAKTKTYPHAVIYGGVFYPANTPIEVVEKEDVSEKKEAPKKTTKKAVAKDDNKGTV